MRKKGEDGRGWKAASRPAAASVPVLRAGGREPGGNETGSGMLSLILLKSVAVADEWWVDPGEPGGAPHDAFERAGFGHGLPHELVH